LTPRVSTGASIGVCTGFRDGVMGQITVFSGAERHRRWSLEQKRSLVEAAFAPGAIVSEVARGADIRANQIYRWRRKLAADRPTGFAAVMLSADQRDNSAAAAMPAAVMVIEIGNARMQIMADAPPALVSAALRLLSR
ncbi:MAG: IS66-like element accessory protein TnpA, partial [Polymorphobacter sp.]